MATPNIRSSQPSPRRPAVQSPGKPGGALSGGDHVSDTSVPATAQSGNADNQSSNNSEHVSLPVVEETLRVGKQMVESGKVVVTVRPVEVQQAVDVLLTREDVQIERIAINRVVEQVLPPREEGDVTIIPIYEEVLVTEKRLMLKEEIRLTRKRTQHQEQRTETLRKEEVTISRVPSAAPEGT